MLEIAILSIIGLGTLIMLLTVLMHIFHPVPFVPTRNSAVNAIIDALELSSGDLLVDPGVGDGRLLIAAKKACPGVRAIGTEVMPWVWLLAKIRIWLSRVDIEVVLADALKQDYSEASHIVAYLLPGFLEKLALKWDKELQPGTRIVSYVFSIPGREPTSVREVGGKKVWVYEWR